MFHNSTPWKAKERKFLADNIEKTDKELGAALNRSPGSVAAARARFGLMKSKDAGLKPAENADCLVRIRGVRKSLFETMQLLKEDKIDVEKAKAMAELGQAIINSTTTEMEYLRDIKIKPADPEQHRPPAEYSNSGHLATKKKYA